MRSYGPFLFASALLSTLACGEIAADLPGSDGSAPGTEGPGGASRADEPVACPAAAAPTCGEATDVATAAAFLDAVVGSGAPFVDETLSPASGASLRPSSDLRVTVDLELSAEDLRARWNPCAEEPPGADRFRTCQAPSFAPEHPLHVPQTWGRAYQLKSLAYPSGVTCLATPEGVTDPNAACATLRIAAGTVLRVQRADERFYFMSTRSLFVRLVRPCAAPCAEGEVRCGSSDTCLRAGYDSCMLCEGLRGATCSCRTGCGNKPAGARCSYDTSDDTSGGGACSESGACEASR